MALAWSLAILLVSAVRAEPQWPDTELSRHVQAWFAHLTGSESQARTFLEQHLAPAALAEVPVEVRLERRRRLLDRSGGLTPLEVLSSTESAMSVRVRDGHGEEPVVLFEAEAGIPAPNRFGARRAGRAGRPSARTLRTTALGRGGHPPDA